VTSELIKVTVREIETVGKVHVEAGMRGMGEGRKSRGGRVENGREGKGERKITISDNLCSRNQMWRT
jgi:hypothetical protein